MVAGSCRQPCCHMPTMLLPYADNVAAICRQCCCHMPATLLAAADYWIDLLLQADRYGFCN